MKQVLRIVAALAALGLAMTAVHAASSDKETIELFRNAGASAAFFKKSYGFAVFPNIGKAGFVVGGAHGSGRVYQKGLIIGTTSMTQVSVGLQLGGQDYSEIVFFEDERALREFTSGNFEFAADAGVVAITAGASVSANTGGSNAAASGGEKDAVTAGEFHKGMAVFTILKGGLMYSATIAGQKFSYTPKAASQ
jgi:lipid-binding SYLF domain-containing protein